MELQDFKANPGKSVFIQIPSREDNTAGETPLPGKRERIK
jgi:hypothetical protein